jgi:hypothetical protein
MVEVHPLLWLFRRETAASGFGPLSNEILNLKVAAE